MSSNKKFVPKKKSPVIKTLQWLGVSAVSILLIVYFLVVDTRGSQKTPTIGSVNGTPIYYTSTSPYGRAFNQIETYYKEKGLQINNEMYGYIEDLAFRQAVSTILLNDIARKNINVSDNFIVEAMKSKFIDTNGVYNQMAYESFIKNSTQSDKLRIEKDLKEDILAQTIYSELFTSIKINPLDIQKEYKRNFTKRDIEMVYINAAAIVQANEIADNDLEKYFTDNKTNFAQADISWIITESGGVADNLYKTLKDDITLFEKTAMEKSFDTNNYKLGYLTRMQMPSEDFANKIFANNTKGSNLLQPIYANGYYYIVLVNDIRIPEKYTDVNKEVLRREYLNSNINSLLEAEKTKQAEVLKAAVAGINNLAALDGNGYIKYYKPAEPFSYNQGRLNTAEGTIIPDSSSESFYMHIFSMQPNQISDVIKLDNGVAVIRLVSEEKPNMADLNSININTIKRQRINNIQLEWENEHIAEARVKKHNIR
ncbi:peptidylprolyl isomerase [Brachyspira hampsonii]|uniref:Peptidylprolyl isomerase n=1 Tax=Brachyspira hampsonii TaxID=1287055 RepID=A0A1E5NAR2_9SPIR|nr:SurA N-terminal domain-containing protein [Brachyspira hampsonii]OEJ13191.1 peptidylprolyl isomerase [Brachyspira hampsonii]